MTMPSTAPVIETLDQLLALIAPAGAGREIHDPATGETVGRVQDGSVADLNAAVAGARAAQPGWAAMPVEERNDLLRAAADAVAAHADVLAELLTREQGKPLARGSRGEVAGCVAWLRATAALTLGTEVLADASGTRTEISYRPLGVIGAINPWNFPMMISVWQLAPSLKMGNTIVMKPSEHTPLSVLGLAEVINQVLPPGVLQVVAGGREVGAALTAHPDIAKIVFTGSTATGKAIIRSSADTVKRLTLELGGNDPGIVLPDADPTAIAEAVFWSAFMNSGQVCAALKRLYVHDSIYDAMCEELAAIAHRTTMGNGLDDGIELGPLQNADQHGIVAGLVDAARASGARIVTGGNPDPDRTGHFYPVTIVADIDPANPLVTEEQFGPALPIVRYIDIDDAIAHANALTVGLGASVWSSDPDAARIVAARLEAGSVWINRHGNVHPNIPFGGTKQSGYGLEFGVEGLKQLGAPQVISY